MTPVEQLKSVLCDPTDKCCIAGSDEDRAIIDRALQALAAQPFAYAHWEERIKDLMNQVGMPNSRSLAEAMNQLVNEMMQAAPPAAQTEQEDGCPICGSDVHDRDALDKAEREIERLTALVTQLAPVQGNPKDHYNAGWRDVPVEKEQA